MQLAVRTQIRGFTICHTQESKERNKTFSWHYHRWDQTTKNLRSTPKQMQSRDLYNAHIDEETDELHHLSWRNISPRTIPFSVCRFVMGMGPGMFVFLHTSVTSSATKNSKKRKSVACTNCLAPLCHAMLKSTPSRRRGQNCTRCAARGMESCPYDGETLQIKTVLVTTRSVPSQPLINATNHESETYRRATANVPG